MKTLATLVATASLAIATPVFACPHEDAAAPKTAEKAKDAKDTKAKEQPKQEGTSTAKAKAQPKQDTAKKPDKVSQK